MPEHAANDHTNRHRTTDPDASGSWRAEYAFQGVDADLRADGGRAPLAAFGDGGTDHDLPDVGDRVRDRDGGDELVVVDVHDASADEYAIDGLGGATVADANPAYDPDAEVVEAVYVESVRDRLDGWRSVEDLRDAVSFDAIDAYSFPADRLAAVREVGR